MQIRHTVASLPDCYDREQIKQALCRGEGEGDFRLLSSGDTPSQATRFQVDLVEGRLQVAVLAFASRSHGEEETIELLLDPLADGVGYLQFGVSSSGQTYETSHWPYRDPDLMGAGLPDWSVEVETEEYGEDVLWFYFFSVDIRDFPVQTGIGLNLCRSLNHSQENSSWNLVSGIGFPDAGCFGRLWLSGEAKPETPDEELPEKRPIQFQGTYDWPDNVGSVAYTLEDLQKEMIWYRDCGLERVYWLDYLPSDYDTFKDRKHGQWGRNIAMARESFGTDDFLPGAAEAARAADLEFITIFKPFDLHLNDEFVLAHPECAMRRNPAWPCGSDEPVDHICLYGFDDRPWPFDLNTLEIWISDDNQTYRRLEGSLKVSDQVVERLDTVWTPRGSRAGSGSRQVRCVTLSGMDLNAPYFSICWSGQQAVWRNRLYRMIEIFGSKGDRVQMRLDLRNEIPESGFSFSNRTANAPSWGRSDAGMDRLVHLSGPSGAIGLTRSFEPAVPGMPEPMFPEVEARILQRLQRGLDAGADGISLRIAHHVGCDDWVSYMFAEPVLAAFRERTGRDPEAVNEDFTLIRCLRGEAYTALLRKASKMARAAGKKFTHHLENRMLVPPEVDTYMHIHWDWETWIREGLVDEVDLKYIGPDHRDCRERIVPLCREHGVRVNWITPDPEPRWKGRSIHEAPFLIDRARAGGLDGINLYELWLYHRMTDRGTPMVRGCGEAVIRGMKKRIEEHIQEG